MKYIKETLQITVLFVGTIVGAGLASGREILIFFSRFGIDGFKGITMATLLYIFAFFMIIDISYKFKLASYSDFISKICPGFIGHSISTIMTFYILCSTSIILAGSGAIFKQFFGLPNIIGMILMIIMVLFVLNKKASGLIFINSIIVPTLISVLLITFIKYIFTIHTHNLDSYIPTFPKYSWLLSSFIYAGFNILSCSGVIIPISKNYKNKKTVYIGVVIGSLILCLISYFVNFMIIDNMPIVSTYEIPLLFIARKFSKVLNLCIVIVIWFEMFSTKVADIFSISNTLKTKFNLDYKKSIIIILTISIMLSQIGFSKLIEILYPIFGVISLLFLCLCILFYFKDSGIKKH